MLQRQRLNGIIHQSRLSNHEKIIHWMEKGTTFTLFCLLIILHFILLFHSGGLWRDEVNSVQYVTQSPVFDFGTKFQSDSFPILWFLLLRFWIFLGFGGSDLALRVLGLLTGLASIGVLWHAGKRLGSRLPIIALVLFALPPVAFVGDSLRAYGLGVSLILMAFASMGSVIQNQTPRRMIVCVLWIILSVQTLYNNSFLILAICSSAALAGLYRRQWKLVGFSLGAGLIAAATALPYLWTFSDIYHAHIVTTISINLVEFIIKVKKAIEPQGIMLTSIWMILLLTTAILLIRVIGGRKSSQDKQSAIYLLGTLLIGIVTYFVFFKILSWTIQSWYYLPLMAVLALIVDRGIAGICQKKGELARIGRLALVLIITLLLFKDAWQYAFTRKTTVDVIANKLETLADRDDMIVITRFYYGVSFARYYQGDTPWITVPEIDDYSVHRYDLFKKKMMEVDPIEPVLKKITATLQEGHRVWVVGYLSPCPSGFVPKVLPPAPHSSYWWNENAYELSWLARISYTLQLYGQPSEGIQILPDTRVNETENLPLMSFWNHGILAK